MLIKYVHWQRVNTVLAIDPELFQERPKRQVRVISMTPCVVLFTDGMVASGCFLFSIRVTSWRGDGNVEIVNEAGSSDYLLLLYNKLTIFPALVTAREFCKDRWLFVLCIFAYQNFNLQSEPELKQCSVIRSIASTSSTCCPAIIPRSIDHVVKA
jgi:hypothetical protein